MKLTQVSNNTMSLKVLILGVNGFIGSKLAEVILAKTDWEIYGLDLSDNKLEDLPQHSRFHFMLGDMRSNAEWIEQKVQECDVVLPLVAIANPATYVNDPLRVFELDFEANLQIVRYCVQHKTRILFPSTSEVYGMCDEEAFDEETSKLILGPIQKERWIYSCSKQLMDRVIYAYGKHHDLPFTLFRPFNWIGPKQDDVQDTKTKNSRVVTQFISRIMRGEDISLVDGGLQQRSFTYLDDGIDCLMKIIENKNACAEGKIFNIGNPDNNTSIKDLAEQLLALAKTFPKYAANAEKVKILTVDSAEYYGKGYQDVKARVPAIHQAEKHLGWKPVTNLNTALQKTLAYYCL